MASAEKVIKAPVTTGYYATVGLNDENRKKLVTFLALGVSTSTEHMEFIGALRQGLEDGKCVDTNKLTVSRSPIVKPGEISYVLTLSEEEAEYLLGILNYAPSVEWSSDKWGAVAKDVYSALREAGSDYKLPKKRIGSAV